MPAKCPQCGAALPSGALEGLCPACLLQQGAAETAQPETVPFQPPGIEEVSRLFPQLEILEFIGKGGMGAVYKARQPALDRFVALKILPAQTAGGSTFAERFNREARALAKLNHPNIVTLYEFGQAGNLPFFIMEFVDGLNLRQLERAGRLSPREALQIVPQICEALQFAHDEGIVHRDIKPENILLDKKGRVKIADFGIAKIMGREERGVSLTETNQAIGTPHYMAPEQVEQPQAVDHRADIYSLGVVFYEMLTGELPLGKFGPPSSRLPGVQVDVRLDEVVLRALEQKPELRFQKASEVKTVVETIAGAPASPPPPDAGAFTREILARDYVLNISSCLQRAWTLLISDFWTTVGITALLTLLNHAAWSSGIGIVVSGPLMGGLSIYYLKRIRKQPASLETAFSGFSTAFVPLFLGGLVSGVLKFLGFLCLLLPGIYFSVAWMFTLSLIIDKRLDFWPAMELSRKTVGKHWWKFFGFWLVSILLYLLGVAFFGIGFLLTTPIACATATFAYEDIFSAVPAGTGPSGTAIYPGGPVRSSGSAGGSWKPILAGLAVLLVAVLLVGGLGAGIYFLLGHRHAPSRRTVVVSEVPDIALEVEQEPGSIAFGPVTERVVNSLAEQKGNDALELRTGLMSAAPASASESSEAFTAWLKTNRMDLFAGYSEEGGILQWKLAAVGLKLADFPGDRWADASATNCAAALASPTALHRSESEFAVTVGQSGTVLYLLPPAPELPLTFAFETRGGDRGLLQILGFQESPRGLKLRYKCLESPSAAASLAVADQKKHSRDSLNARAEAAGMMTSPNEKDRALAAAGLDAAKAGEAGIAKTALRQILSSNVRDEAMAESSRVLAQRGMRRDATEIVRSMISVNTRDQAAADLAVDAAQAGDVETVKSALRLIGNPSKKDEAAQESVRRLVKHELRKAAKEIVREISNPTARDRALAELAK